MLNWKPAQTGYWWLELARSKCDVRDQVGKKNRLEAIRLEVFCRRSDVLHILRLFHHAICYGVKYARRTKLNS